MPISYRFILFQTLIIGPFMMGMFLKPCFKSPNQIARRIVLLNLCMFDPVIILWTVWGLEISVALLYLPFAGLWIVTFGFAVGYLFSIPLGLSPKSRATFVISASLSNHGFTLGGFVCYLLLGEEGLALAYIFLTYFVFYLFMFIFPYARWAQASETPIPKYQLILDTVINVRNIPLYTTLIALTLQIWGIPRFAIDMPVDTMLLISISIYYFSLGLTYSINQQPNYKHIHGYQVLIKFGIMPMFAFLLTYFLPLDPLMVSVIQIQSFMPVAILSVVVSILFELDTPMAASLFVWNTIVFLVFVFPFMYFWG